MNAKRAKQREKRFQREIRRKTYSGKPFGECSRIWFRSVKLNAGAEAALEGKNGTGFRKVNLEQITDKKRSTENFGERFHSGFCK